MKLYRVEERLADNTDNEEWTTTFVRALETDDIPEPLKIVPCEMYYEELDEALTTISRLRRRKQEQGYEKHYRIVETIALPGRVIA